MNKNFFLLLALLLGSLCVVNGQGGGENSPSRSITASITPTISDSNTPTPIPSNTPSVSPTNTPTPSSTPTNTPTPSVSPTNTPTPSSTSTTSLSPSVSPTNTPTPSSTPTNTPTPSVSPTTTPTPSSTSTTSLSPSVSPTNTPTPTSSPSTGASLSNTPTPTSSPSVSSIASASSTNNPSGSPSSMASASSAASASSGASQSASPSPYPAGGVCVAPPQICKTACDSEGGYDFVAVGYNPSSPGSQTLFRWTEGSISQPIQMPNANPPYTFWEINDGYYGKGSEFCANIHPDNLSPSLPSSAAELTNATELHISLNSAGYGVVQFILVGNGYTVTIGFYKQGALGVSYAQRQATACSLNPVSQWAAVNYTVEKPAGTVAETGLITCFQKRLCGNANYLFGCDGAQICTTQNVGSNCSPSSSVTPIPSGASLSSSPTPAYVIYEPNSNEGSGSNAGGSRQPLITTSSSAANLASWMGYVFLN